jgi:hypothetical protein
MSDRQSSASFLIKSHAEGILAGRDAGYTSRLVESFADSFHNPQTVAEIVDLALCAVARLAEETGSDWESTLAALETTTVRLPRPHGALTPAA